MFNDYAPQGKWDNARRWYPSETEIASCCKGIRAPSRRYPFSLWKHCHTLKHQNTLRKEERHDEKAVQGNHP